MRRPLAILLLVAVLALAACGSDNSDNAATPTGTGTGTTADKAGGATTSEKKSGRADRRRGGSKSRRTAKSHRKQSARDKSRARRQRSRSKSGPSGKSQDNAKQPSEGRSGGGKTTTPTQPAKKGLPKTDSETYDTAEKVCAGLLGVKSNTNLSKMATDFATPWPAEHRDAARDGCLHGLRKPRPPEDDESDY